MAKRVTREEAEEWLMRLDRVVVDGLSTQAHHSEEPIQRKQTMLSLDFTGWSDKDLAECMLVGVLGQ